MRLASCLLLAAMVLASAPAQAAQPRPAYAIDGDSVQVGARTVRVIGIDTPEYGRCGFAAATKVTRGLIADGVRLRNISGRDRYGRTLAYVQTADGRDLGSVLLRKGLAVARYDSRDGYPAHPKESRYRSLDAKHNRKGVCF